MLKLHVLFIPVCLLLFASCTKEPLTNLDILTTPTVEENQHRATLTVESELAKLTKEESVQLTLVSSTVVNGDYLMTFSGLADPASVDIAGNQSITFTNGAVASSLTFSVNSYGEVSGNLEINFDLGGQSLAGLTADGTQNIIIVEDVIN